MYLMDKITTNEIKLLNNIGIEVKNKKYTNEELKRIESSILDFIWSHSTKNNDINKYNNQYKSVLNKISEVV